LYLGAMLCYGQFARFWVVPCDSRENGRSTRHPARPYACALLLFVAAYLAKATAFSFPAVVLLIAWWKRGILRWRGDVLPSLPFFGVAFGLGTLTAWLERTHVGAHGPDWDLSFAERCLVAGRAPWFYVGKLLQPANLCFIYPRWHLDPASLRQWLWPAAGVGLLFVLWIARRRWGRGALTAALFFVGTLFPVLGFLNGYFMRYSFVCDHWVYLSSLGLIALGAASVVRLGESLRLPVLRYGCAAILLPAFAVLTWRQSGLFTDSETLYRATLALNPNADLAHNNLGLLLAKAGQFDEAIAHFQRAVEIRPGSAHAHNNLANAFRFTGRAREAAEQYEISLKLEPGNPNTWNNLALLRATSWDASVRNGSRAVELAEQARKLTPKPNPIILATLAAAYAEATRYQEAVETIQQALRLLPPNPGAPLAKSLQAQLELYSAGAPFHEPDPNGPGQAPY